MLFWSLCLILVLLSGMLGVAFITLLERKILGLTQIRLGPNKVTWSGLLQPLADGIKLLFKQLFVSESSQSIAFIASPMFLMIVFTMVWGLSMYWQATFFPMKCSALLLFSLLGLSTYAIILAGWSIMSSFSKLGSLRSILQSLSYEVALILTLLIVLAGVSSLVVSSSWKVPLELACLWLGLWMLLALMESNRAPFDLLEGESELISGFNIEMGSLLFVFLFLSEYGMVIAMPLLGSQMVASDYLLTITASLLAMLTLLIRSCYPRIRYDVLMGTMWQTMLPVSLFLFTCFVGIY